MTRAGFEITDELPPPMPVKILAKGEAKKKLSLMDYQNRKKSASPVENGMTARTETKTNGTVHAKPLPPKDDVRRDGSVKVAEKINASRQPDARPEKPRSETNGDRYVDQTPMLWYAPQATDQPGRIKTSQVKSQPEVESRKRAAEPGGDPPLQKRTKGEAITAKTDQPRQSKPETPRGREATERPLRDTKVETLHPTHNGMPPSSSDRDRENTPSPRSTIQVNGSRPRSNSGTPTPRKPEPMTKPALPRLLSPLPPSLFHEDTEKDVVPRKKLTTKPSKPEKEKAKKPPLKKIPALLSPTLPPVIEEILALQDRKQTASKGVSSQSSNQSSDSSGGARKTIVAAPPGCSVEEEEAQPSRPSKIVTLKFRNKGNAKRFRELLSLPSKSAKDALKKERSESAEAAPPPAKKRPRPVDDVPQETTASKRPKMTADVITAKPAGPTTPLKHTATSMSRVTSSQSQGQIQTPAATTGLTPSTSDNRPPTRSEPLDPKTIAQAEAFKERNIEYTRLGSNLKHARDDLLRDRGAALAPANERRVTALHFEMVLAYMVAFDSLNQSRMLERKVWEVSAWESLLPHLNELRSRVQNKALRALAVQMHALSLEQITNAFATLDPGAAAATFSRWGKHNRARTVMWGEAVTMWERVDEPRMRVAMGPWTTVNDAVAAVLGVMGRWAEREGVRWQPEVSVKGEVDRERDREKDRERESYRDGDKDRDRDRDRDRERDRGRDRGRERERERERDRPRQSLNHGPRY